MVNELTKIQWKEILSNMAMTTELDLAILQTIYSSEGHKAYASQVGVILGHKHGYLNLEIGKYAKRIAEHYDINFTERSNRKYKYWDLFFMGWKENHYFAWQLKPSLVEALKESKLTDDFQSADEISMDNIGILAEGIKKTVMVNSYERNSRARQICINHWGLTCAVCNVNLEKVYGEIAKGFIHIHHLIPVSQIGESYKVNPIEDLRPVCPNCHAILHRCDPPMQIEELKSMLNKKNSKT